MNEYLLKQAIRSDLEWILNSPPLLAPNDGLWSPEWLKIQQNQIDSFQPDKTLLNRPRKLGAYFEALASTLFELSEHYQILAQNLIIQGPEQTLGEVDLLVREISSNRIIHIELALKFYIWVPSSNAPEWAWIGAGLHDFLCIKLQRLFHHQLRLPEIAHKAGCWPKKLPLPEAHYLWMPGRLYLPEETGKLTLPETAFQNTPWRINPHAQYSYWLAEETSEMAELTALTKVDWLTASPITSPPARLPDQFVHPNYAQPVYVLPKQWHTNALNAIHRFTQQND